MQKIIVVLAGTFLQPKLAYPRNLHIKNTERLTKNALVDYSKEEQPV